jgi:hypothetical protein
MIEPRRLVRETEVQGCDVTKINLNLNVVHCYTEIISAFLRLRNTEHRPIIAHLETIKYSKTCLSRNLKGPDLFSVAGRLRFIQVLYFFIIAYPIYSTVFLHEWLTQF